MLTFILLCPLSALGFWKSHRLSADIHLLVVNDNWQQVTMVCKAKAEFWGLYWLAKLICNDKRFFFLNLLNCFQCTFLLFSVLKLVAWLLHVFCLSVQVTVCLCEPDGEEAGFDAVESSSHKLVHLTASRAKGPKKRPPSTVLFPAVCMLLIAHPHPHTHRRVPPTWPSGKKTVLAVRLKKKNAWVHQGLQVM